MSAGQKTSWRSTIGLEVHAELSTATKMFCSCKNDPDEVRPNVNICPICLAHPGTLPAANQHAVEHLFRIGAALGGTLADFSEFDRKSYFYPDIPKGYQITQYEHPFVAGGELAGVKITRVHLEEDTARSTHAAGSSLVDFNRAGVPLMELVTEPVIHDAETAGAFARELQQLLRSLDAGKANLEKGEMRIEANISVSSEEGKLGTKVEVKNLNSFRSVERAIAYEVKRQSEAITRGEKVVQETRGWDEGNQQTFSQRPKEGSADYRYFPEPDLPKVFRREVPEWADEIIHAQIPELPATRRDRYEALGLKREYAEQLAADNIRSAFFDTTAAALGNNPKSSMLAANYLISDLAGDFGAISPGSYAKAIMMIESNEISSRGAKDVLVVMKQDGGDPETIAKARGLLQVHDEGRLGTIVEAVIATHAGPVADYKAGKAVALQYLVGQAMKESKGAGNPELLRKMLVKAISG